MQYSQRILQGCVAGTFRGICVWWHVPDGSLPRLSLLPPSVGGVPDQPRWKRREPNTFYPWESLQRTQARLGFSALVMCFHLERRDRSFQKNPYPL